MFVLILLAFYITSESYSQNNNYSNIELKFGCGISKLSSSDKISNEFALSTSMNITNKNRSTSIHMSISTRNEGKSKNFNKIFHKGEIIRTSIHLGGDNYNACIISSDQILRSGTLKEKESSNIIISGPIRGSLKTQISDFSIHLNYLITFINKQYYDYISEVNAFDNYHSILTQTYVSFSLLFGVRQQTTFNNIGNRSFKQFIFPCFLKIDPYIFDRKIQISPITILTFSSMTQYDIFSGGAISLHVSINEEYLHVQYGIHFMPGLFSSIETISKITMSFANCFLQENSRDIQDIQEIEASVNIQDHVYVRRKLMPPIMLQTFFFISFQHKFSRFSKAFISLSIKKNLDGLLSYKHSSLHIFYEAYSITSFIGVNFSLD
ncbi:MAG: hypothetical protein KAH32_06280 [Chlamydiia bacterium]|nr:hypothetical protein [Chlamydiia bacterium]